MTFGLLSKNDNGKVIVSTETFTYHFVGVVASSGLVFSRNTFAGGGYVMGSGYPYTSGVCVHQFYVTTFDDPLIFIKPGNTGLYYAVITHDVIANNPDGSKTWSIKTMHSGMSDEPPTLFVFDTLKNRTVPNSGYGMALKNDGGHVTFHSNHLPMVIAFTGGGMSPSCPLDSGCSGLNSEYDYGEAGTSGSYYAKINTRNMLSGVYNAYTTNTGIPVAHQMIFAPMLNQAGYDHTKQSKWTSDCGLFCSEETFSAVATWFSLYKGAVRLLDDEARLGWVSYYNTFQYDEVSDFSFFGIVFDENNPPPYGLPPMNRVSINMEPNTFFIADSRLYQ